MSATVGADPRIELARSFSTLEIQEEHLNRTQAVLTAGNADLEVGSYFTFMAGAHRALYVDSDPSAAILLAAQACESLLDSVLLHILWWDGETAESAGQVLAGGIAGRVQNQYTRLGGDWALNRVESLRKWRKDVADERNRIAHGGRRADAGESVMVLTAARQLYDHFITVANQGHARGRYPALAALLDPRIAVSGSRRQREALEYYLDELIRPAMAFRFYRALANRERWNAIEPEPMTPTADHAEALVTVQAVTDNLTWYLYDAQAHVVIEADAPMLDQEILPELIQTFHQKIRPDWPRIRSL